jgi:hypothetical protein
MRIKTMMIMMLTAVVLLVISGCSSNFLVYKNGKHFYVTSTGPELKRILCDSGDLKKITVASKLPEAMQLDLQDGICNSSKVRERVLATLEGMTKEQRGDLKLAFQMNGYDVNTVTNC